MKMIINGRKDLRLPLLVGWCLSSSQIAGFFDYQYLCKESVDTSDFWDGTSYQVKVVFKTTGFDRVRSVVPLAETDCRIL